MPFYGNFQPITALKCDQIFALCFESSQYVCRRPPIPIFWLFSSECHALGVGNTKKTVKNALLTAFYGIFWHKMPSNDDGFT